MRVLTPSGKFESRSTPSVAAERRAIKAVIEAASEYGPVAKNFLTGNAALMGGGATPGGSPVGSRPSSPGTSWSNQGNALIARVNQRLQSEFGQTSPELEQAMAEQGLSWGPPFPPGRPLNPFWGNRRAPRTWDFAVGENVQLTPRWNRISFKTLKAIYEQYDVAQLCVRHLVDDVRSLDVSWLPPKNCKDDVSEDIEEAEQFWAYPDRRQPFDCWLAEWLQDVLRYDAGALFIRETEAGDPYAIEVVSGETIIPLIDFFGRRPEDSDEDPDGALDEQTVPAFLQIIEGLPWDWMGADQMIYQPLWPLPESQYGQCPLESILLSANTDIRFQWHFLQYFTEGTLPAGFMEAPPDLSDPAQVEHWQESWDALMLGDQTKLNQIRWVPNGAKFTPAKAAAEKFDPTFPLALMRRCAAAYKVTPADLGYTEEVNKASSEIQIDVQARVGRGPILKYVEGVVNLITQQRLGLKARMLIEDGQEEDRVAVAQAHSIYISKGVESPDEVRAELGKPINKDRPFPRFVDNTRAGPISELAIASQAGKIDPETYGRAKDQPLVNTAYASPPGVLPPMGSPEQKAAAETTAQASRDLIEATTGTKPPTAEAAEPPGEEESGTVDEPAAKGFDWRAALALIDAIEKGEATGGITAATGVQGVDFQGSEDEDDDEDEEAAKASEVALEMRRWRENTRNRLKKGRAPRRFSSTVLEQAHIDEVWAVLKDAKTRGEVDAAFAGLGKPSAGGRPAFHSQADRIVEHYTPQLAGALANLFSTYKVHEAIAAAQAALPELTPAEKAAVWDKASGEMSLREHAYRDRLLKDAQLDLAVQAARQALESEGASTDELHTILVAMYGDGFLQGAHDAAAAAGGDIIEGMAAAAGAPPAGYWDAWKPGYGQAAAQAADGGMRDLLDKADITIQGLANESIDRIGNTISEGLGRGDSVQTVGKAVREVVESPARAETVANTEMARAMTTASVETYESLQVAQVQWLAEDDACPECEANAAGSPYALDDAPQPPEHPNCFPAGTLVSAAGIAASTECWWEGELIEVVTDAGRLFAVTPNHPILTPEGWVAAAELVEGSYVVGCLDAERVAAAVDPHDHYGPALIEDVAVTLGGARAVAPVVVPLTPEDLHGDGVGSEVCVVRTDRLLRDRRHSTLGEPNGQQLLSRRRSELPRLARRGSPDLLVEAMPATTNCRVCGRRVRPTLLPSSSRLLKAVRRGDVADGDAAVAQGAREGRAVGAELCRELLDRFTSEVVVDPVVAIRRLPFAGHVYNLQTGSGWYIANGIVAHNCRCALAPVVDLAPAASTEPNAE